MSSAPSGGNRQEACLSVESAASARRRELPFVVSRPGGRGPTLSQWRLLAMSLGSGNPVVISGILLG